MYSQFIRQSGSITQRLGAIRDNKEIYLQRNLSNFMEISSRKLKKI